MLQETPWYKDAIFMELNTRAFKDSDADGWGGLAGFDFQIGLHKSLGGGCDLASADYAFSAAG
jgi:hypothetical protein